MESRGHPNALKPPFVLQGDDLASDTFWHGDLLNTWAENWITYWTAGQGSFAMSDFEDAGNRPGPAIPLPSASCRPESAPGAARRQ